MSPPEDVIPCEVLPLVDEVENVEVSPVPESSVVELDVVVSAVDSVAFAPPPLMDPPPSAPLIVDDPVSRTPVLRLSPSPVVWWPSSARSTTKPGLFRLHPPTTSQIQSHHRIPDKFPFDATCYTRLVARIGGLRARLGPVEVAFGLEVATQWSLARTQRR